MGICRHTTHLLAEQHHFQFHCIKAKLTPLWRPRQFWQDFGARVRGLGEEATPGPCSRKRCQPTGRDTGLLDAKCRRRVGCYSRRGVCRTRLCWAGFGPDLDGPFCGSDFRLSWHVVKWPFARDGALTLGSKLVLAWKLWRAESVQGRVCGCGRVAVDRYSSIDDNSRGSSGKSQMIQRFKGRHWGRKTSAPVFGRIGLMEWDASSGPQLVRERFESRSGSREMRHSERGRCIGGEQLEGLTGNVVNNWHTFEKLGRLER